MITGLCDEFPKTLGKHRELFVLVLLGGIFLCCLPTCTYVNRFQQSNKRKKHLKFREEKILWQCSICLEAQLQSFLLSFWRQLVYFGFMGSLGKKNNLGS